MAPTPGKTLLTLLGPRTSSSPTTAFTDVSDTSQPDLNAPRPVLLKLPHCKTSEDVAEMQTLMGQVGDGA